MGENHIYQIAKYQIYRLLSFKCFIQLVSEILSSITIGQLCLAFNLMAMFYPV